ncbi:MAG TPA: SagB/ThcOx family dehydrogenase [Candidatus Tectomicrobia bacterium]|nr:SagB/ThcOx family dehydrogenase [Candidatus Tectomicrobia bacterium]
MTNRDLEAAWTYHNTTKHSYENIHADPHYLDWENQPLPFKVYKSLDPAPLPRDLLSSGVPALSAVSAPNPPSTTTSIPSLSLLASLLYFSAGITKRKQYAGGEILFRAAACTGALYHIELYLVCGDLPELKAGVYHFGPGDFALRCLRQGDYRQILVRATGGEPAVAMAPLTLICTGTYWRNAWKYRARTYRHCFWDTGTIVASLLAVSAAHAVPAKVVMGFIDETVNRLLGLDTAREVALTLVPLGYAPLPRPGPPPALEPLVLETLPLSSKEVDYPAIRAMHAASSLNHAAEAGAWHGRVPLRHCPAPTGELFPLESQHDDDIPPDSIEQVILRRGSSRRFARVPISFVQLSTLLRRATRGIPADFLDPPGAMLNHLYLIVNAVDDLPHGAYVFRRDHDALELLRRGDFRRDAGYLGLMQEIPADASVDIFFLTDLQAALERFGNRGYRAAQLEAGIIGGKLYLSAYAQGLGASGLTFFDDDVTHFFAPHAADQSVMFLVALGKAGKVRPVS